jgi:hypothetical protein
MPRIQSTHRHADRGLDAYFTPREAVLSLLAIEPALPMRVWEPACGDGAISRVLTESGRTVFSTDFEDHGFGAAYCDFLYVRNPGQSGGLLKPAGPEVEFDGIVTNPPYRLAFEFVKHAVGISPYVALLLRTNFLESLERFQFFRRQPPARLWVSSRRLPMMHRNGWDGPRSDSNNTCHAWFVWDTGAERTNRWEVFDWLEYAPARAA